MQAKKLSYPKYLQLDKLLNAQQLESRQRGDAAHDEMFFIIIHQIYELWFKQILTELDSVLLLLHKKEVRKINLNLAWRRLQRVVRIQHVLLEQLNVLETLEPLDFLSFRHYLTPASGFQSYQFRLLEAKLGLPFEPTDAAVSVLPVKQRRLVLAAIADASLYALVEKWLCNLPELRGKLPHFVKFYQQKTQDFLHQQARKLKQAHGNTIEKIRRQQLEVQRENFATLYSEKNYQPLLDNAQRQLNYKATLAAVYIQLHQEDAAMSMPYAFISTLVDIDELLAQWRHRHALMVQRMIGSKVGTGGTSGYHYLQNSVDRKRVFKDLANIATYLVA